MMNLSYYAEIQDAALIALAQEKVVSARAFDFQGTTVVAVLTEPIYLQSERDSLLEEIRIAVETASGNRTVVTYDLDVYRKIKDGMPDEIKKSIIEKLFDDN